MLLPQKPMSSSFAFPLALATVSGRGKPRPGVLLFSSCCIFFSVLSSACSSIAFLLSFFRCSLAVAARFSFPHPFVLCCPPHVLLWSFCCPAVYVAVEGCGRPPPQQRFLPTKLFGVYAGTIYVFMFAFFFSGRVRATTTPYRSIDTILLELVIQKHYSRR